MAGGSQSYDGGAGGPGAELVPWVLFGAFAVSHLLFLGLGLFMRPAEPGPDLGIVPLVLTAVGLVPPFLAAFGPGLLGRGAPFLTHLILRFALAESAAVMGLVLALLGADLRLTGVLAGLALLAHLVAAPTERAREAHARHAAD